MKKFIIFSGLSLVFFFTSEFFAQSATSLPIQPHAFQILSSNCSGGIVNDDGTFENGYGWNAGYGWGRWVMKMTPPSYPYPINHICIALTRTTGTPNWTFNIDIFDTTGSGGGPGNLVDSFTVTAASLPVWPLVQFNEFFVTGIPTLTSGSYYIGISYDPAVTGAGHYIGSDESSTSTQHTGYGYIQGAWSLITTYFPSYKNLGVRAEYALPPPPVPTLFYPFNGATNLPLTDTLVWLSSSGATSYRVQVATDSLFSNIVVNDTTIGTSRIVTGLSNNTWYWWHVNARNPNSISAYSSAWKFQTIVGPPPPPTLIRPINGATLGTLTPWLVWNNVPTATSYRVNVSLDSTFGSTQFDTTVAIDSVLVPGGKLAGGATYYWRVRGANIGGIGNYSVVWHFATPVGIHINNNEIPKTFKLYVNYPNPFNPTTQIKFDLPKSSLTKLIIYDILGREVSILINEELIAGSYEYQFNGDNVASGVYFYKIEAGNYSDTKKMLLIK